ncbi:MAG: hypothetical protein GBAus27B_000299 [Mycoplasmataceae bacterium]|nr:MAG: hypothetical protein GBAus27B_000299 [Mycoplasmataceae bacterium]
MTQYKATELERVFKNAGRARKSKKEFSNDAGYWEGGRCNWGGSHNLKEDCETLAKSLGKMESLGEIKRELEKCTDKDEYEAKKVNYIRKCQETLTGLQTKTSSSSSIFGICIIWTDEAMDKHVISKLEVCRKGLEKLKNDLENESYKWVQEIKQLKLEQQQIQKRMEENKKKATDKSLSPSERALLMQLIEDDGKKLKGNLEKQREIDKKFRFEPEKYVSDLIKKIKQAIEKGNKSKETHNCPEPNNDSDSENSDSDIEESDNDECLSDRFAHQRKKDENKSINFFFENKQLILVAVLALSAIIYIYLQKDDEEMPNKRRNYQLS